MVFRLVQKSVTLNDIERRNGRYFAYFSEFRYSFRGALRKSSRSLSHLLMSYCCICDTPLNCYYFTHQSYPFAHLTSFRRITKFTI